VMSPQGGEVAFDSGSVSERWLGEGKLTTTTRALTEADPTEFDATLIVGGHGALADLVHDDDLHRILASFVEEGKPIGAVDHGAAVLTSVRPHGAPLLSGVRATGRSDDEEHRSGHRGLLPRSTQTLLRDANARCSFGPAWRPHVVVDGQLIFGQNPSSTQLTVESLLAVAATASLRAA